MGHCFFYQEKREGGNSEIRRISEKNLKELKLMISDNLNSGKIWDIVFKSKSKYQDIEKNKYMEYALCKLSKIEGNLFLYGLSFSENDKHIWKAIRNNKKINKVYISFYKEDDEAYRKRALVALGDKASDATFFDSTSI